MSFLVWLLYAFKAARKIASKSVEVDDVAAGIAWDIVLVEGAGWMLRE